MASYTDYLVGKRSVVVHISVTDSAFHIVDAVFRHKPLLIGLGCLLLVTLHARLFSKLDAVAVRTLARGERWRYELLPTRIKRAGPYGPFWTIRAILVLSRASYRHSERKGKDRQEVDGLFHCLFLLFP
jgi:hypothetical protein